MSREGTEFDEIAESSVQLQEGRYKIKLPFKKENVTMPNNLCVAKQHIRGLRKTFQKDASFHDEYTNFLADVIRKGYAEQVPQHQLERYCIYLTMECTIQGRERHKLCLTVEQNSKKSHSVVNFCKALT